MHNQGHYSFVRVLPFISLSVFDTADTMSGVSTISEKFSTGRKLSNGQLLGTRGEQNFFVGSILCAQCCLQHQTYSSKVAPMETQFRCWSLV